MAAAEGAPLIREQHSGELRRLVSSGAGDARTLGRAAVGNRRRTRHGDVVVLISRWVARGRESQIAVDIPIAGNYRVTVGKIKHGVLL
jgi:hypothetical protein